MVEGLNEKLVWVEEAACAERMAHLQEVSAVRSERDAARVEVLELRQRVETEQRKRAEEDAEEARVREVARRREVEDERSVLAAEREAWEREREGMRAQGNQDKEEISAATREIVALQARLDAQVLA